MCALGGTGNSLPATPTTSPRPRGHNLKPELQPAVTAAAAPAAAAPRPAGIFAHFRIQDREVPPPPPPRPCYLKLITFLGRTAGAQPLLAAAASGRPAGPNSNSNTQIWSNAQILAVGPDPSPGPTHALPVPFESQRLSSTAARAGADCPAVDQFTC